MRRAAVLLLVLAACGSEERAAPESKPPPKVAAADAAPAPAPMKVPPELEGRYRLAAARADHTQPLPATPIAFVSLASDGALRRGTLPSLDGAAVAEAAQLAAAPPTPTPADTCTGHRPPPSPRTLTLAARKDLAITAAPLVLADRAAVAHDLAEVLHALDGASLGVAGSADAASAFALGFARAPEAPADTSHTLYVYIVDQQLSLSVAGETYGGQLTTDGALDTSAFEATFGLARKGEGRGAIELLVAADQPVGLVVAVLDALVGAGVTELTIAVSPPGFTPGSNPGAVGGGRGRLRGRDAVEPSLREGMPTTTGGGNTVQIVRRYVRRQRQKLLYCYERALPANPDLAGAVKTTWIVRADGTVGDPHVDGPDRDVDTCMRCVIERIEFPPPEDGKPYDVAFPLTLVAPGE